MDNELERLKQRRLLELQRKLLKKKPVEEEINEEPKPKDILSRYFSGRAWEVYNAAVSQFPRVIPKIEKVLIEAIQAGKILDRIDGESLFHFFKQIGLSVRLKTSIRFKEHGELKTLEQKIKEKK